MADSGQQLEHQCFDFRLQEWRGHYSEQGFEVVFDEVHDDKNS